MPTTTALDGYLGVLKSFDLWRFVIAFYFPSTWRLFGALLTHTYILLENNTQFFIWKQKKVQINAAQVDHPLLGPIHTHIPYVATVLLRVIRRFIYLHLHLFDCFFFSIHTYIVRKYPNKHLGFNQIRAHALSSCLMYVLYFNWRIIVLSTKCKLQSLRN